MTSSKLKPLLFLCAAGVLSSCAQSPQQRPADTVSQSEEPAKDTAQPGVAARQLYQLAANYQAEPQHYHLLKAARQALIEQDYLLALAICENLKQSPFPLIRQQNLLPLLHAYIATGQQANLSNLLEKTDIKDVARADQAEFLWLTASYHSEQRRYLAASRSLLQLEQYADISANYPQYNDLLWRNLSALSDSQLESLRVNARQNTLAWLNLAQLSRRHIGEPEVLQQAFTDWQRRYSNMPPLQQLPEAVQQLFSLQPFQPAKIAVLLPLQGQFRQHAQAIQYGILAAAGANNAELVFIDSQQPAAALREQISALQAEFVIGPLLKDQVDTISNEADWPWPTLFLNTHDTNKTDAKDKFYFALSMEDEATQVAELFQQKSYRRPVVISAANNIAVRMQQHFSRQWQQLGHPPAESYQFNSKEDLEALIASLLETDRSRERLKQINSLVPQKLETEPHSRLDIDAIYLIADPVQTQLFKPFVDVSVSPTAPRLPIYASSRSHSTSLSSTDLRDLNGLTFTEMPWMLGEQSSVELRAQYQQLFKEQDETLQRLFAMGYDAFKLVGSLRQQQQLPSAVFPGLTGQLRLSPDGSIVRQLSWASYRNSRLSAVQEP
ncbi:penicillin-binding protein activator [Rheinheimera sp. EpRS3]|uniref:penicillin-binding protein activator n=1 Tax=Rheinheimera sp. EpRS3 TaxID=1712383 RepID=UPI001E32F795|nr:penicillin-binding protein activator [Rheinheimera sp. EpRS3]